ncbi:MAG TPA: DUF4114 domain-containing protein [Planctomycetota bacterium]
MNKLTIVAGLALAVVAAGAMPAAADETFVANYGSLTSMVDGVFGAGNWVRLDDNADRLWAASPTGSNVGLLVIGKDSQYVQNVGYVQGGAFTPLIATATVGESSSGPIDGAFFFADLTGPPGHPTLYTSDPASNPDGGPFPVDHMVSFMATTGAYAGQVILAFEDLPQGGDKDFNDVVLLASGVAPVPEPGTMVLLGSGLAGLLAYARRRRVAA